MWNKFLRCQECMNGDSRSSWQMESGMGGRQGGCFHLRKNFKNCFGLEQMIPLVMEDSLFAMVW